MKHVVFVTWKAGNAPAFEAAKRLGHHVTLIRSQVMEQAQNIDFDSSPYARFVSGHTLVVDGANWQRRSLTNPTVVPVREQMGKEPFSLGE